MLDECTCVNDALLSLSGGILTCPGLVFFLPPLMPSLSTPTLSPLVTLLSIQKYSFSSFMPVLHLLLHLSLCAFFTSSSSSRFSRPVLVWLFTLLIFSSFLIPFFFRLLVLTRCHVSIASLRHIKVTFMSFFSSFLLSLHLPPVDALFAVHTGQLLAPVYFSRTG